MTTRFVIGSMLALIVCAGCSSDPGSGSEKPAKVCAPGKTEACACVGLTVSGAQTCEDSGEAWSTCRCPGDIEAGGSGSGGAGGQPVTECTPGAMQDCSCNHCKTPGHKICDEHGYWGALCTSVSCETWLASGQPDCTP